MSSVVDAIREELEASADEKTREGGRKFFKEEVAIHGVNTALVGKIAKKRYGEVKSLAKKRLFELCEELWKSGYMEESFIACDWSYLINKEYEEEDFETFEKWVGTYVNNWASCDTLCNHSVGSFVSKYPAYVGELKRWAKSENRWMRRASAVSLIIPAKRGDFLPDIFGIADILLPDEDDLVRKGYGWMLKAASQAHQKEVFEYVMKNKKAMPRTALRYAIEKMPEGMRKKAMER